MTDFFNIPLTSRQIELVIRLAEFPDGLDAIALANERPEWAMDFLPMATRGILEGRADPAGNVPIKLTPTGHADPAGNVPIKLTPTGHAVAAFMKPMMTGGETSIRVTFKVALPYYLPRTEEALEAVTTGLVGQLGGDPSVKVADVKVVFADEDPDILIDDLGTTSDERLLLAMSVIGAELADRRESFDAAKADHARRKEARKHNRKSK